MSLLQKLCARLTGHRYHRKYDTCKKGERWCRCRICGYHFWIKEDWPIKDPCDTCPRWYECNGVDRDNCPLWKEDDTYGVLEIQSD